MRWLRAQNAVGHQGSLVGRRLALEHGGRSDDGLQRVRRSWLSTGHEHLVDAQRLGARAQLVRQRLFAPVQFKEHAALLVSMCGSMGLYRKSTAPLSYPRNCQFCSRDPAVAKMSGCRVRSLPRISSASSNPFISGICTSSNARATSSWASSSSEGLGARLGLEDVQPVTLQQRLQGDEVFLDIVNEQAFGAVGLGHGR